MEHKIIQTENYLLVVSDDEIKDVTLHKGKWQLEKGYILNQFPDYLTDLSDCKIIIAHLPLNNSPILQGVDLLPPLQDNGMGEPLVDYIFDKHNQDRVLGFIDGYNKAKEKYKYTEEDMREMFEAAIGLSSFSDTDDNKFQYALQSLSQPKMPIGFECETNILSEIPTDIRSHIYDKTYEVPKTTTNGQYQTLWVGEYVYEN